MLKTNPDGAKLLEIRAKFLFLKIKLAKDNEAIIENATICKNGDLTLNFEYLRNYVNGN